MMKLLTTLSYCIQKRFHHFDHVHIRRCFLISSRMAKLLLVTRNSSAMNCLKFIPDEIDTVAVGRISSKYCSTPGISSTVILSVTLNISDKLQALNSKNIVV
ncbi:hypothetical protein T07_2743 [Trichinella nelsoni]|uniref:Uncharacterized protein n=1 Tax=Trichinella nelsoni TaxID=6336 RepID=A0A0V0RWE3_9BILA|nr:hypothetical protein T07_2743 [Trichinella nelsoni]